MFGGFQITEISLKKIIIRIRITKSKTILSGEKENFYKKRFHLPKLISYLSETLSNIHYPTN